MSPREKQTTEEEAPKPTKAPGSGGTQSQEQLREEIEETRHELGQTVEALAHKGDVKGRVKEKVADQREQFQERQERAKAKLGEVAGEARQRPVPIAGVVAGLGLALVAIWLARRR